MPPSPRYLELARFSNATLEALFRISKGPAPEALAGWEWRGYNTPWTHSLLGIRKFIKGFFKNTDGKVEGYNIPPRQNAIAQEWLHKPSAESPKRFGFFTVDKVQPLSVDNLYINAVLLDYGASSRNDPWRPERVLRDYVIQPDAGNPDLLVGKAYLALGPRLFANFFIIERLRRTDWKP
jgi:hypothetical protein